MRIDQYLNKICIIKTRNIANKACHKHLILINNQPAKASSKVKENDEISVSLNGYKTVVKVEKIPSGNVSKKSAMEYYQLISRDKMEEESLYED